MVAMQPHHSRYSYAVNGKAKNTVEFHAPDHDARGWRGWTTNTITNRNKSSMAACKLKALRWIEGFFRDSRKP